MKQKEGELMENPQDSSPAKKSRTVIELTHLRKVFQIGKERVVALNDISLSIQEGEICCLLGTSGSGKSTLLNMMAGLDKSTAGQIVICGQHLEKMSERRITLLRQKYMGFVFQSYNLLPNLTAIENVALPLTFRGVRARKRNPIAVAMLKAVGLGSRMKHKPTQMSGGQQQRVGIARAFAAKPKIIFADEPTGNLDSKTTVEVMEMMVRMARENKQTMIIVTHERSIAHYADKVYFMRDGCIYHIDRDASGMPLEPVDEAAPAETQAMASSPEDTARVSHQN